MDLQTREIERACTTGDLEAVTKLIQQRLRSGVLSEENLELAAWVGHPAAQVLRPLPTPINTTFSDIREQMDFESEWLKGLAKFGLEARARAAFASIWCVAPYWLLRKNKGEANRIRGIIETLATSVFNPTPTNRSLLGNMLEELDWETDIGPFSDLGSAIKVICDEEDTFHSHLRCTTTWISAGGLPQALTFRAMGLDVGEWALGLGDPITRRIDPVDILTQAKHLFSQPHTNLLSLRAFAADVTPGALRGLAHLHHPIALELLGEGDLDLRKLPEVLVGSTKDRDGTRAPLVQLGIALAEDRRASWERRNPDDPTYRIGLEALNGWMVDPSRKQLDVLKNLLEAAYEGEEPPWALYRAGMVAWAKDLSGAVRAAWGAVRWTLADRLAEQLGEAGTYQLKRRIENDRLASIDPDLRTALGLDESDTIFTGQAQEDLRHDLRVALTPQLLRSCNPIVQALSPKESQSNPQKDVPSRGDWEDYLKLPDVDAIDHLVQWSRSKELPRKTLKLVAFLGHSRAQEALSRLRAKQQEEPFNPHKWCDGVWTGGKEVWARAVYVAVRDTGARPSLLAAMGDWLADPCQTTRQRLRGSIRRLLHHGEFEMPTEADGRHAKAIRSALTRRRNTGFYETASWVGTLSNREAIAREIIPWALGFTRPTTRHLQESQ